MKTTIKIKDSWEDVTIADYNELQNIKSDLEVIFILTDLYTIKGLSEEDLTDILSRFKFLETKPTFQSHKFILVDGKVLDIDTNNLTASQYIDLQTYLKSDIQNLSTIISLVAIENGKEYGKGYDIISNAISIDDNIPIGVALGIYSDLKQTLSSISESFEGLFESKDDDEEEDEAHKNTFQERWGWVYLAEKVAEVKRCKLDEVFELGVVEFLNFCSYVKEKNQYEYNRIEDYKRQ